MGHAWALPGTPGSCLVGSSRELTFLFFAISKISKTNNVSDTQTGHAWASTGTSGRCLEGVTPGLAGIFSALIYFVAETPTPYYIIH